MAWRTSLVAASLALLTWTALAPPAAAQSAGCVAGWMNSCASVQVTATERQLHVYVPNATPPSALREASDEARRAAARGEPVRVYRDAPGAVCDPASGHGCVDVTAEWLGSDPGDEEEEEDGCVDGERRVETASGDSTVVTTEDRDAECAGFLPHFAQAGAVTFAVSIPVTVPLWLDPGDDPIVVGSAVDEGEDQQGEGGEGSESGNEGGDEENEGEATGNGDGDDNGDENTNDQNGDEEKEEENGDGGNESQGSTGNDGNGNTNDQGDDGNGDDYDDDEEGDLDWPSGPSSEGPPMTEVPEPISTTLVGLGLLGYAGARARRRRQEEEEPDGIG